MAQFLAPLALSFLFLFLLWPFRFYSISLLFFYLSYLCYVGFLVLFPVIFLVFLFYSYFITVISVIVYIISYNVILFLLLFIIVIISVIIIRLIIINIITIFILKIDNNDDIGCNNSNGDSNSNSNNIDTRLKIQENSYSNFLTKQISVSSPSPSLPFSSFSLFLCFSLSSFSRCSFSHSTSLFLSSFFNFSSSLFCISPLLSLVFLLLLRFLPFSLVSLPFLILLPLSLFSSFF